MTLPEVPTREVLWSARRSIRWHPDKQMQTQMHPTLPLQIFAGCIPCATVLRELAAAMLDHVSDAATVAVHVCCSISGDSNSVATASCK
jgi:hypothetical protein